ncbi:putative Ig domain-containing protein [Lysobacter sp. Root690]|uniref:putative Ig domain-containing protein n=1 Tax=Lysobacter sp. Root690 TaxID=1736588 RepID=UPI001F20727A|nr:putative Ig domain-containing protein [Lysobacter sp. Root690]
MIELLYDGGGRPVGTRAYATAIAVNTDATFKSQLIAGDPAAMGMVRDRVAAIADDARDLRNYQVYDSAGRIAATIDGAGYVSTRSYDAAGRVVQERRHVQAATIAAPLLAKLSAGTASVADIAAITPVNNAADAVVRHIYDAAGRERYTLTQNSATTYLVSERRYDGASRVTAQYQYSVPIALGPVATPAQVGAALNAAGAYNTADLYRSTQYVFDAAGRVRFTVDDLGAVNEQRYDGAGRVVETRRYGSTISISTPMNEAAVATAVAGIADVRKTTTAYDAMGRVVRVTDALNQYEEYTYNPLGQITALRNKNGHVWNYEYDAAGRRTAEISPEVGIGNADINGMQGYRVGRIVTRTAYDALGNVISRTENADTNQPRVTRYEYDNRGNQIRTIFPDAGRLDANKQLVASGIQSTIEVSYDALGRAVAQKDVRGFYSYKVYDNLGRLAYDVDQENYVTAYAYDGFGQQTNLRRYAQKLNVGALGGWGEGQPLSMAQMQAAAATSVADRTITTRYDQRGLAVQIEQTQVAYFTSTGASAVGSPTVRVEYDGFGNKVKESVLLEGTPGQADARWADTYTYYDLVGRVTMTVDAEGYVTRTGYNVAGEAVETIEYAKAIATGGLNTRTPPAQPPLGDATSGYDRVTRWSYDALGRKIDETMVRHFQGRDGSSGVRDVATQFRYDGENRVTQIINDTGTTSTVYDALGRVLNVTEPMRKVINDGTFGMLAQNAGYDLNHPNVYADVSPFTEMMYDAFGNLLRTWKHVSGKRPDGSFDSDPNKDQIEWIRYDWQGRAVGNTVSNGDTTYTDYDAADNIIHRWYRLSGSDGSRDVDVHSWYSFDKAGRQTGMSQTRNRASDGAQLGVDMAQQATYNAFGEIVEKSFPGVGGTHNYNYDAAGRLLSNNEAYGTRSFGYNLAGHQLRESHIAFTSEGQTVEAVSWNTTDRLGRNTLTRLPSHTADPVMISTIQQRVDRWGNVLEVVDARGYRTNYRYNELNQVTRDERPLVVVVSESGVGVWQRPVNEWFYDALGRLLATRDANGSVRSNEYDAVGRLITSKDGLGQATLFAYDAMGNQRITQNPLGYLTYKDYDRQGRLVEIGDYLASGGGRARASLQRYVLNQSGDRLQVFDALNNRSLYDYNSNNQVLRSQTATGVWTSYTYDVMGNKTGESTALSGATFQDRDGELVNGNELTWNYDAYGRLVDHNNLSGRDFDYYYHPTSGQLQSETQSGGPAADAVRHTVYYPNGKIKAIYENSVAPRYRYEYDAAGNRTLEEVNTVDGGGLTVHTITRTVYDSHNRIQRVTQDDLSSGASKRVFDLSYSYDAVGNRRSAVARSGYGPAADSVPVDANNAPTLLQGIPWHSVRPGTTGEFSLVFSEYFRDPEQDPLSLRVDLVGGGALPPWLTVKRDPASNLITFIARPDANVPVQDLQIRMTAYETANPSAATEATFVLFVRNNVEPRLHNTNTETLLVKTGQAWSKDLFAADFFYDLDIGDQMRLSVVNAASLPAWLQLDTSSPGALRLRGVPQSGTYTLQVRATDQLGWESQIKTVQLVVAPNHAPSGPSPLPAKAIPVDRDFLWSMPVSEVFYDADGDGLEIRASGLPSWLTFQRTNVQGVSQLRLVGRPPEGLASGLVYNVAFTATDPDGATRTATLTLTTRAGNQRPTAPQFTFAATGVLGLAYSFQLPAFHDGDGDALTYRATNLPPGLSFDPATRMLFGTPSQLGEYEFKYTATDGMGGITTLPVRLFVRGNTAPVAPTVPAQSVMATTGWNYALPWFTDADGDLAMYTITGLPPGVGYDADTKTMSGAPTTPGTYTVTVQAFDQWGASTATQFTLTVTPRPPENLAPYVNRQAEGAYFIVVIDEPGIPPLQRYYMPADTFRDPDGNPLTYSVIAPSGWGVGIFHTGELFVEGRPYAGVENYEYGMEFRLRATDSHGAYVDMVFGATVKTVRNGGGGGPGFPQDPASLPGGGEQAALVFDMGPAQSSAVAENQDSFDSAQPVSAQAVVSAAAAGNAPVQTTTYWFVYDAENRIKINNGDLVNGQILVSSRNSESYEIMYDAGGNVAARAIAIGDDVRLERYSYDLRGNRVLEFHPLTLRGGQVANDYEGVSKQLFYDANNRLKEVRQYYGASAMFVHRQRENEVDEVYGFYPYGGWLFYGERYDYDADGRMLYQETWQRPQYADESWVMTVYGDAQRQMEDITVLQRRSRTDNVGGYDVGGRLASYRYTGVSNNNSEYTHYYNVTFQGWETYQEESVTGTSSNHNYRTTTNTLTYDPFGHLMSQRENTPLRNGSLDDRMRYYAYNGDARVLTRREGSLNSSGQFVQPGDQGPNNYMLVHAAGQQLAELRQGSIASFNNSTYFTKQIQSLSGLGNYDAGDGSSVPVQAGDTLRSLAVRIYGSDTLWYVLAQANGLGNPDQELAAGTFITAPSTRVSSNDSNTFKPYNPAEAVGSTTPNLPYIPPPPKAQCGAMSKLISVVVTAVVSYFAGPVAGAAAGNYAGQMSQLMLNGQYDWGRALRLGLNPLGGNSDDLARSIYDPGSHGAPGMIDYKSIAVSAAAAYAGGQVNGWVSQGIGGTAGAVAGTAVGAAVSYSTGYAVGRTLGMETHFSLREMAAQSATAVAGYGISKASGVEYEQAGARRSWIRSRPFSWQAIASDMLSNLAEYGIRKAVGVEAHWHTSMMLADAAGNALGHALVGGAAARRVGRIEQQHMSQQLYDAAWSNAGPFAIGLSAQRVSSSSVNYPQTDPMSGVSSAVEMGPGQAAAALMGLSQEQTQFIVRVQREKNAPAFDPGSGDTFDSYHAMYNTVDGSKPFDVPTVKAYGNYQAYLDELATYNQQWAGVGVRMAPVAQRWATNAEFDQAWYWGRSWGAIKPLDDFLAGVQSYASRGRQIARESLDNSSSEAELRAKIYINGAVVLGDTVLQGTIGTVRTVTSPDTRDSLVAFLADPEQGSKRAAKAIWDMPLEDKFATVLTTLMGGQGARRLLPEGRARSPFSHNIEGWGDLGLSERPDVASTRGKSKPNRYGEKVSGAAEMHATEHLWRDNDVPRTLEGAIDFVDSNGAFKEGLVDYTVTAPNQVVVDHGGGLRVKYVIVEDGVFDKNYGVGKYASYETKQYPNLTHNKIMSWGDLFGEMAVVRVRQSVLNSDRKMTAIFGHEFHELRGIHAKATTTALPYLSVLPLIERLHVGAVAFGDNLVNKMVKEGI